VVARCGAVLAHSVGRAGIGFQEDHDRFDVDVDFLKINGSVRKVHLEFLLTCGDGGIGVGRTFLTRGEENDGSSNAKRCQ